MTEQRHWWIFIESSRTTPQSVYKAENLTEGEHTLYAVTQKERSGSAVVDQVAYVQVTHSPYIAKDFKLEDQGISLSVGQSYAISYSYTPSYATLNDMSYTTSDENIASVSEQGTVTAKKSGTASDHGIQPEGRDFQNNGSGSARAGKCTWRHRYRSVTHAVHAETFRGSFGKEKPQRDADCLEE